MPTYQPVLTRSERCSGAVPAIAHAAMMRKAVMTRAVAGGIALLVFASGALASESSCLVCA